MAKDSLTSVSTDQAVTQHLHWDTESHKIEVVHEIFLKSGRNVSWNSSRTYKQGEDEYPGIRDKYYPGNSECDWPITEYIYDEYVDDYENYDHTEKFPESGDYYPLSDLNHTVGVVLNRLGDPEKSKTSGEALD